MSPVLESGPVFRPLSKKGKVLPGGLSDRQIARIIQRTAIKAGLNPALYGGHSLRRGFVTGGNAAGLSNRQIMKQTGHKSPKMVQRYIDEEGLFVDNPAAKIMAARNSSRREPTVSARRGQGTPE